jgi:hypothetical protein
MTPILLILLGGIAYRIRGGLIDDIISREMPNNFIRSFWALYITLLLPLNAVTPIVFALALIGVIPSYWGGKFDLTKQENRTWKNYAWLALRGAFITAPMTICLHQLYPFLWFSILAGVCMPLCYLIGVVIPEKRGIITHSQTGEFLIGCTICASIIYPQHFL